MNTIELYEIISNNVKEKIHFLKDKPEETLDTTIRALWLAAAGIHVSAARSLDMEIPDLTKEQIEYLYQLIQRRINNTPLAHLTGRQHFMGLEFIADDRALIPRKETEILGNKALEIADLISQSKEDIRVIDACCGSGNLGIAIAHYNKKCRVYASDISFAAVELAKDNIHLMQLQNRITIKQGDLLAAFETKEFLKTFDLIVCNPPYILSSRIQNMDIETASNEPALAFDGGMLGIKIIQRLIREAPPLLADQGWLIFEVGSGQGDLILQLCERSQLYSHIDSVSDESGIKRVVMAQL